MLGFLAGVVIFILLLLAKTNLAKLLLIKKEVAIPLIIIVLSEILIVLNLYLAISVYKLDAVQITIGFFISLVTFLAYLVINFYREKND